MRSVMELHLTFNLNVKYSIASFPASVQRDLYPDTDLEYRKIKKESFRDSELQI